jgi:beta-glucosidase
MVNESGDRVIAAGDYGISVGGGQPATGAPGVQATFAIHGEQTLPE